MVRRPWSDRAALRREEASRARPLPRQVDERVQAGHEGGHRGPGRAAAGVASGLAPDAAPAPAAPGPAPGRRDHRLLTELARILRLAAPAGDLTEHAVHESARI